jgi:hypothetical protein
MQTKIFLTALTPLLVWWTAFLPGTFSTDSLEVVNQIRSGSWNDWHTNAYTAFVWALSFGGRFWSGVTLGQVILMALGVAALGSTLLSKVAAPRVIFFSTFLFTCLPQVGAFSVTAWKDVPSTAGALMLAASLLQGIPAPTISTRQHSPILGFVGALLLAAFRWNGPVAIVILCLLVVTIYRKRHMRLAATILGSGLVGVACLMLPQQLGFTESTSWFNFEVRELHDISYLTNKSPEIFSQDDIDLLSRIMPMEDWVAGGSSCEGVEVLQYKSFSRNAPASFDAAKNYRNELRSLWREIAVKAPFSVATVRVCRAGGVLSPVYFGVQPTLGLWSKSVGDIDLVSPSYVPWLTRGLEKLIEVVNYSEISKSIFLNATLWMIVALIVNYQIRRRGENWLPALLVAIVIITSVAMGANAHDSRYVAGALLISQFLLLVSASNAVYLTRLRTSTAKA